MTEPWLRGPIPDVPPLLQPVAHALVMAAEDCSAASQEVTAEQFWIRPGGVASVGFHLAHLCGSTDRLLTYARGDDLSARQLSALADERTVDERRPPGRGLVEEWVTVSEQTVGLLTTIDDTALLAPRSVGRARLPSTLLGLLFHVAEHAARHTGQIVTTARLVSATPSAPSSTPVEET